MEQNTNVSAEERMNAFAELGGEEEISLRGESIKQFDLGEARHQAIVYPEIVHYREAADGEWKEIDNELESVEEDGQSILRNKANILGVELAQDASDGDLVKLTYEGRSLAWRFAGTPDAVKADGEKRRGAHTGNAFDACPIERVVCRAHGVHAVGQRIEDAGKRTGAQAGQDGEIVRSVL
jgi:hypothetical protein